MLTSLYPCSPQRLPLLMRKKVNQEVDKLLKSDIIEPADSLVPWVSPIVTVPKKSADVRICVNLRELNEAGA